AREGFARDRAELGRKLRHVEPHKTLIETRLRPGEDAVLYCRGKLQLELDRLTVAGCDGLFDGLLKIGERWRLFVPGLRFGLGDPAGGVGLVDESEERAFLVRSEHQRPFANIDNADGLQRRAASFAIEIDFERVYPVWRRLV